jgi:tetratricopeptide (TPR) repeat protein
METAIALNRNWVFAHAALGACKLSTGSIEEAIPLIERAIRLSPRDPYIGNWYWQIGVVHLLQSHIDEAILWLEKARGANSGLSVVRACLASAYALKAEPERAALELAAARRLSRGDRYSNIARLKPRSAVPDNERDAEHAVLRADSRSTRPASAKAGPGLRQSLQRDGGAAEKADRPGVPGQRGAARRAIASWHESDSDSKIKPVLQAHRPPTSLMVIGSPVVPWRYSATENRRESARALIPS